MVLHKGQLMLENHYVVGKQAHAYWLVSMLPTLLSKDFQ